MERISAKIVAEMLGFTTTNLKHYAALLEQNGLEIYRNSRNHREYTQDDVKILKAMQYLNREKSMSLDDAAIKVTSSDFDSDALLSQQLPQIVAQNDANISVVKQESDSALRILAELSTLLAEQKAIREELIARDKLQIEFMSTIDGKLAQQAEAMKEQAATIEAINMELETLRKQQEEKPTSFWGRLFGRK
ncbi:MerR family transcriptional regulator [Ureibacillus aquaedulcis]|uniref:MerR family transcriptional regulator n=1 Tax=Ureibacillus aquaedulcis TaxID=3058421 RepID=A0ABT8GW35_9BACL|nr:MerR family transcriptional regulator [Ureibacillus sp. BA0131]MDN4495623.1 MerR family transcriptional regulator [Ureibacillus sp. BA0131]